MCPVPGITSSCMWILHSLSYLMDCFRICTSVGDRRNPVSTCWSVSWENSPIHLFCIPRFYSKSVVIHFVARNLLCSSKAAPLLFLAGFAPLLPRASWILFLLSLHPSSYSLEAFRLALVLPCSPLHFVHHCHLYFLSFFHFFACFSFLCQWQCPISDSWSGIGAIKIVFLSKHVNSLLLPGAGYMFYKKVCSATFLQKWEYLYSHLARYF